MAKPNQAAPVVDRFDQEEEFSSFPPYWKAAVGEQIDVIVEALDQRDPEFPRYVFRSAQEQPIECFRGDKSSKTSVSIQKGELFTSSVYAGLNGISEYAGLEVRIKCTDTRDTGQPKEMFVFKIGTTAETRKLLADRRSALAVPVNSSNSGARA